MVHERERAEAKTRAPAYPESKGGCGFAVVGRRQKSRELVQEDLDREEIPRWEVELVGWRRMGRMDVTSLETRV